MTANTYFDDIFYYPYLKLTQNYKINLFIATESKIKICREK